MNTTTAVSTREDIVKLAELIRDIRVAMLITYPGSADQAHARPMYTQKLDAETFDGVLWFMTDAGSEKLAEIADDSKVLITYAAPDKNRFVVIHGQAREERDPAKARELWNVHAKGWYPNGPDDPALRLIQVRVESGEYWDGPSNVSYMLKLAQALIGGKRVDADAEHGNIHIA